uniref:HNH endonuclease n=1 Tax=Pithovirus LCPAC404 TaxID=2506597 RepID=A0A481ZBZ8_9VIRU|nr:MAG: HNH endonuclease [Pithovirus LCPAC404]
MKCDATTKRRKQCKNNAQAGKTKCRVHNGKKKKAKVKFLHTPEKDYCPLCDKEEIWKSMECYGYPNYELSSLGKCWSFGKNILMKQTVSEDGYIHYGLSNIDNQTKLKGVHTWQGSVFFELPLLYGDPAKMTKGRLTMDHINRVKHQNFTCCNLVPATSKQQAANRENKFSDHSGRIVLKLSLNGQTAKKYKSIAQAAREMKTSTWIIADRCDNNISFKGYKFRFFTKEDLGKQKWLSTSDLYPDYAPIEVSEEGYILRANGAISKGFERSKYYSTGWKNIKENAWYNKLVHDIIWSVFHGRLIPDNLEIGHKNRDGKNNHIDNLELVTRSENMKTSFTVGTNKVCVKVRRFCHDGTFKDFDSLIDAEKETKTDVCNISKVINGNVKTSGKDENNFGYCWVRIVDGVLVSNQYENFYHMKACMETAKKSVEIKVRALFYNGSYKDFNSLSEAASEIGNADKKNIGKVIKGKYHTSGKDKDGYGICWVLPSTDNPIENRYGSIEKMKQLMENSNRSGHRRIRALFYDGSRKDFDSVKEAALEINKAHKSTIYHVINGKLNTAGTDANGYGIAWVSLLSDDPIGDRYGTVENMKIYMEKVKKNKTSSVKVTQVYENGEYYDFNSIKRAVEETGDSRWKIDSCINSKQKKTYIDENGDEYTWIRT